MWLRTKILTVMLLWASCFPLLALGLPYASHMIFATLRAILAGLSLIALALILKRPFPKKMSHWAYLLGIGYGATTLGFWGMFHATEFVAPGLATVIANTQPIIAAIIAYFMLNERLGLGGNIGIATAFLGVIFIATPEFGQKNTTVFSFGLFYIFVAALGISVSNILIRRIASNIDGLWAMGIQLLLGSIPLAVLTLSRPDTLHIHWTSTFIISLIAISVFGTALAYWLWCQILTQTELTQANIYSFLIPIFGLLMGILFYQEQFGWFSVLGITMTIIGIILVNSSYLQLHLKRRYDNVKT